MFSFVVGIAKLYDTCIWLIRVCIFGIFSFSFLLEMEYYNSGDAEDIALFTIDKVVPV